MAARLHRAAKIAARSACNARGGRGIIALQLRDDALDRPARRELHNNERDQHDPEQGWNHQKQAARDIGEHDPIP